MVVSASNSPILRSQELSANFGMIEETPLGFAGSRSWIWAVACLLLVGFAAHAAQSPVEVTDKVRIRKTEVSGFVHPGIGLNKEMLEDVRVQVLAKRDPWYSGFVKLASSPRSSKNVASANQSKTDSTRPEMDAFQNAAVEGRLKTDSDTAMRQTLMYWFTGDETYRANAMRIVRLWSKMAPEWRGIARSPLGTGTRQRRGGTSLGEPYEKVIRQKRG